MEEPIFAVPLDAILELGRFVSKDAYRYCLHGIGVEPVDGGGVVMCATDGTTLRAIKVEDAMIAEKMIILPPRRFPKRVPRHQRGRWFYVGRRIDRLNIVGYFVLADDVSGAARAMTLDSHEIIGSPTVDGTFPYWRRTIPRGQLSRQTGATFDPVLVGRLRGQFAAWGADADSPHIVTTKSELGGITVFMPLRTSAVQTKHPTVPDWAEVVEVET